MIWTVGDRNSGCENWFISCASILGILKDQIHDLWLTVGHLGKFIYLLSLSIILSLSLLKDYKFVR